MREVLAWHVDAEEQYGYLPHRRCKRRVSAAPARRRDVVLLKGAADLLIFHVREEPMDIFVAPARRSARTSSAPPNLRTCPAATRGARGRQRRPEVPLDRREMAPDPAYEPRGTVILFVGWGDVGGRP